MKKEFNVEGVCINEVHYLMDTSEKIAQVMDLIERGKYFVINRPRQYGKTTMLHFLAKELQTSEEYFPIELNFQGIDEQWHQFDRTFAQMFVIQLMKALKFTNKQLFEFIKKETTEIQSMDDLSDTITEMVHLNEKKIILLIDEVDASSNYDSFLRFLGMLRTKYLARYKPQHATFHSVVLAGVHDIKSLKRKVRPEGGLEFNSPWNIAADFNLDMSFNPKEIAPMLEQYCQAEKVTMDIPLIVNRLHYYTSGYPFLVSKLCKLIVENILPQKKEKIWTLNEVEKAVQLLLQENNTNFGSLIKKLENNPTLYELVRAILVDGISISFNPDNPVIHLGILYGIFKRNGRIRIHNRIYEQRLYNYFISKIETTFLSKNIHTSLPYQLPNKELDIEKVLLKFQQFIKEQYSKRDHKFLEREWRMILLAFLQPILNGQGYTFKEVQTSEEWRLDVVITYFQHQYILELKIWYGQKAHQRGLQQLSNYLDAQQQKKGYLVIFEGRNNEKSWRKEHIQFEDKDIFAVWV